MSGALRLAERGANLPAHAPAIPALVRATGPVSYRYQFGERAGFFDDFVAESWRRAGTLFAHDAATLAFADDTLVGLELGFPGPEFYARIDALAAVSQALVDSGRATLAELRGLARRAGDASYLNAHLAADVYYVLALSVADGRRARGVGALLLRRALEAARAAGFRALELDVLADNPAVRFYERLGLEVVAETRAPRLSRDYGFPAELRMRVAF